MYIRKLVKAGPSSHTVSLPKGWLEKHKLSKGSTVYINEGDTDLRISTDLQEKPESREKTIEVDKKDLSTIGREIASAYINNYSSIVLIGDSLHDNAKEIRRLLRDYVALEITEQTSKRLVAHDLLNLKEISVDKTLRRMDMVLRSMLQDSITSLDGKNLYDSIALRDYDMNRMYFLLYRLLKGSMNNPAMAQHLQLSNDSVFSQWQLVTNLENLADAVKNGCKACQKIKTAEVSGVKDVYSAVEKLYLDVMKAQFTNDKALADSVAQNREGVVSKASKLLAMNKTPTIAELSENFKSMATLITNIARGVIDRE